MLEPSGKEIEERTTYDEAVIASLVGCFLAGEDIGGMWVWVDEQGNTWADDEIVSWAVAA